MVGSFRSCCRRYGIPLAFLIGCAASAQASGEGSTGGAVLKIPVGARPTAIGGAFVGLADDLNALYWNPSGLALIESPEMSLLHTRYLADITYQSVAYAQPLGVAPGTLAVSLNVLNYGRIERTIEDEYGLYRIEGQSSNTSPRDLFLSGGWGVALPPILGVDRIRVGAAVKMTFQQLTGNTLTGFGLGVGVLWDTPIAGVRVGTVADNLGALTSAGRRLPMSWAGGASYRVGLGPRFRMVYVVDVRLAVDSEMQANLGAEVVAFEILRVRAGARAGGALGGPTLGLGLAYPLTWFDSSMILKMDYASASSGELGISQRFQLGLKFGGTGHRVVLGRLNVARERGEVLLTWKGRGPAYHVYARMVGSDGFELLTDRPIEDTHYSLVDLAPGHYIFRVVAVDPYRPAWRGAMSPDIEIVIEPSEESPGF